LKQAVFNTAHKAVKGNTLNKEKIKNIEIPLPLLETQKKIVAKIEELMGKINQAKDLRAQAQQSTSNLLPVVLHQIFEVQAKEEKWQHRAFGDIVEQSTTKNTKRNLPYVGMEDIESHTGKIVGEIKRKNVKSATFSFDDSCVLYGKLRPYLNKVYLPDFEGHCTTEFIPLKSKEGLIRKYLAYWLKSSSFVEKANNTVTGTRMPRANMKEIEKFKIPLPSLERQKEIVDYLDSLSEKTRQIQDLQSQTANEFQALEQSILHKAFEGELI
jgi:type I restriction enzyme S subunit